MTGPAARPVAAAPSAPSGGIELRLPASCANLPTVRAVAGDIAARAEYELDAVADLRLAVDEACATLIAVAVPGSTLSCAFDVRHDRIAVTVSACTIGPTRLPTETFGWRVLSTLVDDLRVLGEQPGAPGDPHLLVLRMSTTRERAEIG